MKLRLLCIGLLLLLPAISCRKEKVEVHSTEDEYQVAVEILNDKQVAI